VATNPSSAVPSLKPRHVGRRHSRRRILGALSLFGASRRGQCFVSTAGALFSARSHAISTSDHAMGRRVLITVPVLPGAVGVRRRSRSGSSVARRCPVFVPPRHGGERWQLIFARHEEGGLRCRAIRGDSRQTDPLSSCCYALNRQRAGCGLPAARSSRLAATFIARRELFRLLSPERYR